VQRFRLIEDMKLPFVRVSLDWEAYYEEFKRAHGLHPLLYKGRLLFPDGWTYSSTDRQGPEWPPPDDPAELNLLQRVYWLTRRKSVKAELEDLQEAVTNYERLIELRSAPIMVRVTVDGKDVAKQLDMTDMRERLAWLREDADVCDRKLVELEAGKLRTVVDGNVQASDFAAPASAR
jgi:hypothetical protein